MPNSSIQLITVAVVINPSLPKARKICDAVPKFEFKKISYERRDYESVDEKSSYLRLCPENEEKRIQAVKG